MFFKGMVVGCGIAILIFFLYNGIASLPDYVVVKKIDVYASPPREEYVVRKNEIIGAFDMHHCSSKEDCDAWIAEYEKLKKESP